MRTDAVILSTRVTRESDLLVACYTQEAGRQLVVARGALKPGSIQGMHLDRGNLVRFELVHARGVPVVTGAQSLDTFAPMRRNLTRLMASWVVLESVDTLVTGQERDDTLWALLLESLRHLTACQAADVLPVLRRAQLQLLGTLGYAPRVNGCAVCGTSFNGTATFSVDLGSAVCNACARSGWYGSQLTGTDLRWLAGQVGQAPCTAAVRRAPTEELLEHIAGRELRSLHLLLRAARM